MAKNIRAALPNLVANSRRANSPLPILLVGAALLAFWILATVLQIQTSEAFILKGPAVTFAPNRHLASWFRTGVVALIAFDAYTDFQYGNLASGPGGQFAFAAVTAFIVAFFGIVGVRLIEHGLTEWSR